MLQDVQPPRDQDFGAGRELSRNFFGLIETPRDIDKTHEPKRYGDNEAEVTARL
jgi:hypothetical protein